MDGMTTHYVNQELAKHRYATLLSEAGNERLVRADKPPNRSRWRGQLTWASKRIRRYRRKPSSVPVTS